MIFSETHWSADGTLLPEFIDHDVEHPAGGANALSQFRCSEAVIGVRTATGSAGTASGVRSAAVCVVVRE